MYISYMVSFATFCNSPSARCIACHKHRHGIQANGLVSYSDDDDISFFLFFYFYPLVMQELTVYKIVNEKSEKKESKEKIIQKIYMINEYGVGVCRCAAFNELLKRFHSSLIRSKRCASHIVHTSNQLHGSLYVLLLFLNFHVLLFITWNGSRLLLYAHTKRIHDAQRM